MPCTRRAAHDTHPPPHIPAPQARFNPSPNDPTLSDCNCPTSGGYTPTSPCDPVDLSALGSVFVGLRVSARVGVFEDTRNVDRVRNVLNARVYGLRPCLP